MYQIKTITEKSQWEQFIWAQTDNSFYQSWSWGEVQKGLGHRVWRLGIYNAAILTAVCQVVKVEARRGTFLFLRHGPIVREWNSQLMDYLIDFVTLLAKREKAVFLRMNPLLVQGRENDLFLKRLGFLPSAMHSIDAEVDWRIDLSQSEDELLKAMRKNTRNLVRRSAKEGVTVRFSKSPADISAYLAVHEQTLSRKGFRTEFGRRGIALEFQQFADENQAVLALAEKEGQLLAGALVLFYGKKAIYHHAATISGDRKSAGAYGLMWEIMRYAKKRGLSWLNLWGIAPNDDPSHPWAGLTFFKKGFGGEQVNLVHLHDKPLNWRYFLIYAYEFYERWRRGY